MLRDARHARSIDPDVDPDDFDDEEEESEGDEEDEPDDEDEDDDHGEKWYLLDTQKSAKSKTTLDFRGGNP